MVRRHKALSISTALLMALATAPAFGGARSAAKGDHAGATRVLVDAHRNRVGVVLCKSGEHHLPRTCLQARLNIF